MIAADNELAILAVVAGLTAGALWMESRPRLGQWGVIAAIMLAGLLGSFGVMPGSAPLYGLISSHLVALAIPLLLLQADLRQIWRESGRVLLAFGAAALCAVIGALVAASVADLGPDEGLWVSVLTPGFVGGGANVAAVADALGVIGDPAMGVFVASVYAVAVPYLALLIALPGLGALWRLFSPLPAGDIAADPDELATERAGISALSLAAALALSALIVAISNALAIWTAYPPMKYLALTLLSVAFATAWPGRAARLQGHYELGQILIYMFFVVVGLQIDFGLAIRSGGQIVLFTVVLLVTHLTLLAVLGRVLKLNGPELAIASNACILGPPTAAAMAVARGWHKLTTPGILVGVLGYALANLIGIALSRVLVP